MRIAVVGGGSAGFLAAAMVSRRAPHHALCHIYDSLIPPIGVGEGTLLNMPTELCSLSGLEQAAVQRGLEATRKYGVLFQGWGRSNPEFIHHFFPIDRAHGYHLSTERLVEFLGEYIRARTVDARVTTIARVDNTMEVGFEGLPPERFDFVIDARGFPRELDRRQHLLVPFIPTNAAIIRRGPATAQDVNHTYTRSVARPNGWVFVIPLAGHTSYGYIYNRDITSVEEAESDFDAFMSEDGVRGFVHRAVTPFPNYIHRHIYDGLLARIGNAAGFMEPLEASALALVLIQIHSVLDHRLSEASDRMEACAKLTNDFLVRLAWRFGLFLSWHYSRGSTYDSRFWRFARDEAWPRRVDQAPDSPVDAATEARRFEDLVDDTTGPDPGRRSGSSATSYAVFRRVSFRNVGAGLGYVEAAPETGWWLPKAARNGMEDSFLTRRRR